MISIAIYRVLIWLALLFGFPYLMPKAFLGRHGLRERFGYIPKRKSNGRLFWFHAASVGELKIIASLLPLIIEKDKNIEIAISTTTITGRRRACELFDNKALVFLVPLELKSAINRTISRLRPEKLITVETELWPMLLKTTAESKIELYLVNARLSKSTFGKYKYVRFLFSPILGSFSAIFAQTSDDALRFKDIGARNVIVTGNVKYDQILSKTASKSGNLDIENNGKLVVVAGSLRRGEDTIFADVIKSAQTSNLSIGFIIVPRHMKEIDEIAEVFRSRDINIRFRTDFAPSDRITIDDVLVVNTMGELRDFYKITDIAFVGGSLVPIGGHDPLEPASLGKPVIFGPFMNNAKEAADVLLKSGGATQVNNFSDIIDYLDDALQSIETLSARGEKCKAAVLSMTGASERTVSYLLGDLK